MSQTDNSTPQTTNDDVVNVAANDDPDYRRLIETAHDLGKDWRDALGDMDDTQLPVVQTNKPDNETDRNKEPDNQADNANVKSQEASGEQHQGDSPQKQHMVPLAALQDARQKARESKTDLELLQEENARIRAEFEALKAGVSLGSQQQQTQPAAHQQYDMRQDAAAKLQDVKGLLQQEKNAYSEKVAEFDTKEQELNQKYRDGDLDSGDLVLGLRELDRERAKLYQEHSGKVNQYYNAARHFETLAAAPDPQDLVNHPQVVQATQVLYQQNPWIDKVSDDDYQSLLQEAQKRYDAEGHIPSANSMIRFRELVYQVGRDWKWDRLLGVAEQPQQPQQQQPVSVQVAQRKSDGFPPNIAMAGRSMQHVDSDTPVYDRIQQTGTATQKDMEDIASMYGHDLDKLKAELDA